MTIVPLEMLSNRGSNFLITGSSFKTVIVGKRAFHLGKGDFERASTSQTQEQIALFCFEITVSRRHCEREAGLRPSPKRPKSDALLLWVGLNAPPKRMDSFISSEDIPHPSSIMAIHGSALFHRYCTEILDAFAAIELSIMSARAVSKV